MKVLAWLGAGFITWMVLFAVALGTALDGSIQAAEPGQVPLVVADIPSDYLVIYQQAAERYHLDWAILAAIGRVETDHGQSDAVGVHPPMTNFHGCCAGPMQFCVIDGCPARGPISLTVDEAQAGTWKGYGVDGNHDDVKDPWDPHDAIPAAAKYLKASGAPGDYHHAILAYNHSEDYYANVMTQAAAYRAAARPRPEGSAEVDSSMTPKQVIDEVVLPIARSMGIQVTPESVSEANARHGPTNTGGHSDHQGPPEVAWAADMSNGTAPTSEMDRLAAALTDLFGLPPLDMTTTGAAGSTQISEGLYHGFKVQIIYRSYTGGNHDNHVHAGLHKL